MTKKQLQAVVDKAAPGSIIVWAADDYPIGVVWSLNISEGAQREAWKIISEAVQSMQVSTDPWARGDVGTPGMLPVPPEHMGPTSPRDSENTEGSMTKDLFRHWVRMMLDPGIATFDEEEIAKRGKHDPRVGEMLLRHRAELVAYLRSRQEK